MLKSAARVVFHAIASITSRVTRLTVYIFSPERQRVGLCHAAYGSGMQRIIDFFTRRRTSLESCRRSDQLRWIIGNRSGPKNIWRHLGGGKVSALTPDGIRLAPNLAAWQGQRFPGLRQVMSPLTFDVVGPDGVVFEGLPTTLRHLSTIPLGSIVWACRSREQSWPALVDDKGLRHLQGTGFQGFTARAPNYSG
ncbi:hypothetical protein [Bradyrhizobium sacchari]|uniref:hypothetical protein n=1 Tax=Bradyrhizobium sacchari TaxID=1399419 RepID=UPI0010A9540F|nr:hypothetical protein [Bradyrhizobium sacchari]